MQEFVGKVCLDYTWYPGRDLYSDGAIEDRLLEIAENYTEEELNSVIQQEKDWAVLYHMSHIRENIVDWIPITGKDRVLEVGAGCGAVTGALARKAKQVTCVDLSKKRSLVNANRHRDMDNIRILVGNFQDIEKNLPADYDYITLIGVFEYAKGYIGTDHPYGEFLRQIKRHLKPGGKLVIAIENRLGLKYWAGCSEDHTGNPFEGLENYPNPTGVRTFSKPELERLFGEAGFTDWQFYYPYPDYKLPMLTYSDEYLPQEGELNMNQWNFDRERLRLFQEGKVFDSLIEDGLFPLYSNSFLVILENQGEALLDQKPAERVIYSKFSNERGRKFSIRTDILMEPDGQRTVRKTACYPEAVPHVKNIERWYRELDRLFGDSRISVNRAVLRGEQAELEFLEQGHTLEEELHRMWHQGQKDQAVSLMHVYLQMLRDRASAPFSETEQFRQMFGEVQLPGYLMSMPVTDLDMVTENIILTDDDRCWTLIDYEWTFDFPIPVNYVIYRIWHYFLSKNMTGGEETLEPYLLAEGLTQAEMDCYEVMERNFQHYITGDHVPLREMYGDISPGVVDLQDEGIIRSTQKETTFVSSLYYSEDEMFSEDRKIALTLKVDREGNFTIKIPVAKLENPAALRWDPLERKMCRVRITKIITQAEVYLCPVNGFREGEWDVFWTFDPIFRLQGELKKLKSITVQGQLQLLQVRDVIGEIGPASAQRELLQRELERTRAELEALRATKGFRAMEKARKLRNYIMVRVKGMGLFRSRDTLETPYQKWFLEHQASEAELAGQRLDYLPRQPRISIVVPTYQTPSGYLRDMIESVRNQTYGNWELCIGDGSVSVDENGNTVRNEELAAVLAEYTAMDSRIRYSLLEKNGGISENTNGAAALATGEYIGLLDHDDVLAPNALFEVAQAIQQCEPDVIYTDEDKVNMDLTRHFDPNLKPDFSPDLLRSHNYITHFFVVKKELFHQVGGFRKEYDGAQDYDLIFRCTETAEKICHIPKVLYHWRMHENSTAENPRSKMYAYEAGKKAIEAHLQRQGLKGRVEIMDLWGMNRVIYETPGDPLVSVIIPNKDHVKDLNRCIRSILKKSTYRNLELLIVENNSTNRSTFDYYDRIRKEFPQVRVVRWEKEFNYSAINNFGVREAKGDYLLLLNNDTQLLEPDSIKDMLGYCMRSDVGCVGAKLLFGDNTVQHAGIVLGFGGFAGHVFSGVKKDNLGFMMRTRVTGNYSAVTAACMMVRRDVYQEVGGFTEAFRVALNDVDFCLKLRRAGYVVVFDPFSMWHHYESKSRGYEDTPEKKERFQGEIELFRSRWADVVDAGDPYYNPNFSVNRQPFTLW